MLAHRYKVWSWGPERQDGQEDCIKFNAGITVVAKRHRWDAYEVFNELVAMNLGRYLGLPIPVGFVVEKDGEAFYCSGDISFAGGEFPPANLQHLAINQPRLACGITLFDSWICNADRHADNIFYDTEDGTVFLIDHGQAVLNTFGPNHLRQYSKEIILRTEFAREIRYFDSFDYWHDRLIRIPEHMITDACSQAAAVGVGMEEALETAHLLIRRRSDLRSLFREHKQLFPKFTPGLFPPFASDDDPTDYSI